MKTETLLRWVVPVLGVVTVGLAVSNAVAWRRVHLATAQSIVAGASATSVPVPDPAANRVALLEQLIAEKEAVNARLRAELEQRGGDVGRSVATPVSTGEPRGESGQATGRRGSWLEQIRQQDPERYRQIQAAMEQRRQAAEEWFQGQYQRLDQRLQAASSDAEADLVMRIAEQLQRLEDLGQQWWQLRELPEEQRREQAETLREETRETVAALRELLQQDRQLQLQQLARQVGYRDATAIEQFVESVNGIIRDTELRGGRGWWGGGRGGGWGSGPSGAAAP